MLKTQFHLGASLYVPTTFCPDKLVEIGNGERIPEARSIIFCTEDAVREDQLHDALHNLRKALPRLNDAERPMRFIRVRNPHVLGTCLAMSGIANIDGFVLPKLTPGNLNEYITYIRDRDSFSLMPTLETREAFDGHEVRKLRKMMRDSRIHRRILCLRIGGNDLLNCLRVRRDPRRTIYATPVGDLISRLAGEFIPYGFALTAPVFESMAHPDVLREEVELDLLHGLFGKTAIHPDQIPHIEEVYKVSRQDLEEAQKILDPAAAAVFRMGNRMCEPTTHSRWARDMITRAEIYGTRNNA